MADTIGKALRHAKQMSPGPDGIPCDGWRAAGPTAWSAISLLGIHMAGGHPAPPTWSESRTVFLPKNTAPHDRPELAERWRQAGDTRPITLKNADAKLTASTIGHPFGRILARRAPDAQRGCIPGRDTCASVLLLDATARALSLAAHDAPWPPPPPDILKFSFLDLKHGSVLIEPFCVLERFPHPYASYCVFPDFLYQTQASGRVTGLLCLRLMA